MMRFPIYSYTDHLRAQAHQGTKRVSESDRATNQVDTTAATQASRRPAPAFNPYGVSRILNFPLNPRPCAPSATTVLSAWAQMSGPDGCISPW